MKFSGDSSSDGFLLSQTALRVAAIATGADSIVCYHTSLYSPLPRESLATAVLSGYYNVPQDGILYTLPCRCMRDWLWNENACQVSLGALDGPSNAFPESVRQGRPSRNLNSCVKRLLMRLGGGSSSQLPAHSCKIVVGRWLVALFVWQHEYFKSKEFGASPLWDRKEKVPIPMPSLQHLCRREALRLTNSLLSAIESDNEKMKSFKRQSANTRRVIADLAPENPGDISQKFCEYLESLATEIVRIVWPDNSFHVTANINLLQRGKASTQRDEILNPVHEKVLRKIVEFPVHDSALRRVLRGTSSINKNGVVLRSVATLGNKSPLDYADKLVEQMHASTDDNSDAFEPLLPHPESAHTLVRHASYCGEAYYLYDYHDRLPWRTVGDGQAERIDTGRLFPENVHFLADLQPLVDRQSDAICLVIPLVDDDGEYCIGAINIEGVVPPPYLDPMRIYLAQHVARCATEQIRKMRFHQARSSIRDCVREVLDKTLEEKDILKQLETAKKIVSRMIDNRSIVEFFELGADGLVISVGMDGAKVSESANPTLRALMARIAFADVSQTPRGEFGCNSNENEGQGWWGLSLERGENRWRRLEYRNEGDAGTRVLLSEIPNTNDEAHEEPLGSLSQFAQRCVLNGPARNVLIIPLFAPYGRPFGDCAQFCAGVLLLQGPQSWTPVLVKSEIGRLVTEFKELATLLQRSRMQTFQFKRLNDHESQLSLLAHDTFQKGAIEGRDEARTIQFLKQSLLLSQIVYATECALRLKPEDGRPPINGTRVRELVKYVHYAHAKWQERESECPLLGVRNDVFRDLFADGVFIALLNWYRNAYRYWRDHQGAVELEPRWEVGESVARLKTRIATNDLSGAITQLRWYPFGKPGRGRYFSHWLLKLRDKSCRVEERIVRSESDWFWQVEVHFKGDAQ